MSTPDPTLQFFTETVQTLEAVNGRTEAVEKAVDELRRTVSECNAISREAKQALVDIATTNAARLAFEKDQAVAKLAFETEEKQRRRDEEKAEREKRGAFWEKAWGAIWNNQAVQLLLLGTVVAVLNLLGTASVVKYLTPVVTP